MMISRQRGHIKGVKVQVRVLLSPPHDKALLMEINSSGFICCPKCGGKTKTKVIPKVTELKQFPLWCPWCKTEQVIDHKESLSLSAGANIP